jgi:uncharacterized protein (DUF697 family)
MASELLSTPSTVDSSARILAAREVIQRNLLWAVGASVVPLPVADVLAVLTVQVKMLSELSRLYGVPFREGLARKLVVSLLGSLGGFAAGAAAALGLIKLVPGFGHAFAFAPFQLFAGAFTYACGRVYLLHLESGGTLLDFDPRAMRAHFRREFAAGKGVASAAQRAAEPPVSSRGAVAIVQVHYKGTVKRTQADEYAEIVNNGGAEVDVSGWTLDADATGQTFTFPAGTRLAPGQVVRVYTDEVHPETGGFKFGIRRAIWNDHGDRARLRDAGGTVVSEFAYGNKQ